MELDLGPAATKFRDELRQWLEANAPEELIGAEEERGNYRSSAMREWTEKLKRAGYLCVSWPKEFGGRGLTGVEVAVMNEEFARVGVPRVTRGMGENLVGPSIIVWGTDEQKAHFLPRIIDGVDRYCQGFSEPDAGSDLAGLKTRGVVDGDEVVINGQKVWTSWFTNATMVFTLCRTDPNVPKHQGISYVLVPIAENGIEFRPLKQLSGASHFAETFYTDARAPLFNVIGGLNNGWRVAMTTLGNERGGSATTQHIRFASELARLIDVVRKNGLDRDARVRQQLAWAYTHVEIMRFQGLRLLSSVVKGEDPGPASSISKMFWSEYHRRLGEIAVDILGMHGIADLPGAQASDEVDQWQQVFYGSRSETIWGGTAEVQRNIVGERVLGLPKEPAPR